MHPGIQFSFHQIHGLDRVGFRGFIDRKVDGFLTVEDRPVGIGFCTDLHPRDIFQQHGPAAFRIGPDHDVIEFLRGLQATVHIQFIVEIFIAVFRTDCPGGSLNVLRFHRFGNIGNTDPQSRHTERIQPDTHGIFPGCPNVRSGNTIQTHHGFFDIFFHIVTQLLQVQIAPVGGKRIHGKHIIIALGHRNIVADDFRRELGFRPFHAVLQVHQRHVGIRTGLECDRTGISAAVVTGGRIIKQIFHRVDFIFQRDRHSLCDHFRTGSAIGGGNTDGGRCDLRIFLHGDTEKTERAGQRDHNT